METGVPSRTRTCDILLRRQMLYPAELWAPSLTHSGTLTYGPSERLHKKRYGYGERKSHRKQIACLERRAFRYFSMISEGRREETSWRHRNRTFYGSEQTNSTARQSVRTDRKSAGHPASTPWQPVASFSTTLSPPWLSAPRRELPCSRGSCPARAASSPTMICASPCRSSIRAISAFRKPGRRHYSIADTGLPM